VLLEDKDEEMLKCTFYEHVFEVILLSFLLGF